MPHATGQRQLVGHSSPQPGCGKIRRREHQSCQITTDFPRRTHAPSHSIGSASQHREHNARQLRARGTSCNGLNVLRACALGARTHDLRERRSRYIEMQCPGQQGTPPARAERPRPVRAPLRCFLTVPYCVHAQSKPIGRWSLLAGDAFAMLGARDCSESLRE